MSGGWRIPFRDLRVDDPALKAELLAAVGRVLDHGRFLPGPEIDEFERQIAADCGTAHCIGAGSGTDALYLALRALDIGPGDEVITTALSWIATANAIAVCGATPVFVDIGPDLNIDPGQIEAAITARTRAILPVHFNGRLCDMEAIVDVARRHGLRVVEDAAQAFGARLNGRVAGSFGDTAAFSFNPMKPLAGYGEAGAVVTDDGDLYEKLVALRYLGTVDREICHWPSLNGKIDAVQAAMLLVSRRHFDDHVNRRLAIARRYTSQLGDVVTCPAVPEDRRSVFFDFQIVVDNRDALVAHLTARGIETKIKHPLLMPDQPAYAHLPRPALPVADRLIHRILCLPIHDKMSDADVDEVATTIRDFCHGEK